MKISEKSYRWPNLRDEWLLQSHLARMDLEDKLSGIRHKFRRRKRFYQKLIRKARFR
jgi:hypothetical protein